MVDFTKLAQMKGLRNQEAIVSNSNVRGGNLNNFDQAFSRINMDGFEQNIKTDMRLNNEHRANSEKYVHALSMRGVQELQAEINTSLSYIRQNEQYLQYQQKIKDLLKSTDCENVGELLVKHGDGKKVVSAMIDLQNTFDADPLMKHHYKEVLNKTQRVNQNLNINRVEVDLNLMGNTGKSSLETDQQYLNEIKDVRGSVLDGIDSMDIPFVDDSQGDIAQNLREGIQHDEQTIQKTNELLLNQADNRVENTVESSKVEPQVELEHHKNDDGLSL